MGHLVSVAELFDSRSGVAAADDRDGSGLSDSLGDRTGTGREVLPFGDAHRAVPDDGAGADEGLGEEFLGLFADIETHPAVRDGVGVDAHEGGVFFVLAADYVVDGEEEVDALFVCFCHDVACEVEFVGLADGGADLVAHCLEEGVCHAAADDDGVALLEEGVDDADLVGDLCAAEDSDEGSLRILKSAAHELDLLLDEEAADCRQIVGNAGRGGVSSVSRTESVVYIDIRKGGKSLRECGIVLGLFCVETHVLKEHDFAVLEISGKFFCAVADNVFSHLDILTEKLGKSCGYGSKGELGLELALRSAQMGAKDNLCVMIDKIFDSGEGGNNSLVRGDFAVLERDIEIAAYQHSLAGNVDILN